jgi:formylglycine-generating enzyme required for sulfatase activity
MKIFMLFTRRNALGSLLLAGLMLPGLTRAVSIPDPGLNSAIRDALHKPIEPLTDQDLLSLTSLDAQRRGIRSLEGLEAALNLASLNLSSNLLGGFSFPTNFTKLRELNLSLNSLTNCSFSDGLTNLNSLILENNALSNLTLPVGLVGLTNLDLEGNQLTNLNGLSNLSSLVALDLGFSSFANFTFPNGLTNLSTLYFAGNPLTNIALPQDWAAMTELNLSQNLLTAFTLPSGMTNLTELDLAFNQLTNLSLPADLRNLTELELDFNQLSSLDFPSNLNHLSFLHLRANKFTSFNVPAELTRMTYLDVSENPLDSFALPGSLFNLGILRLSQTRLAQLTLPLGLTNLTALFLAENQLTNLVLPPDLNRLDSLNVNANQLTSLNLPSGLSNLTGLFFVNNQLTNITLPADAAQLAALGFLDNPLTTIVLSEPLATTGLAADVAVLQSQGVSVFTYPLAIQLLRPRPLSGAFQFGITGPPGVYAVLGSTDLVTWSEVGIASNILGSISFTDVTSHLSQQKFYRALLQKPPENMVFIPPNTFLMGSPTNEQDRSTFTEGPQTRVTLTRGFWIGKFEVTQGEYLSVMNTNPSEFPGDLSRPVSSVTWLDATNYCWKLTQRELAAGRIPAGSQYRLPTEAEWECAARAGTTTRFSYGDDPSYASVTNYAWFLDLSILDLTVHSVGQKLPNPWGLYDMAGNVWEWCQDWYGDQQGGVQTDPTGPGSNPSGLKVMRGGAYDYPNSSCRSASRLFRFANSPDTDVGFRVVLVMQSQ